MLSVFFGIAASSSWTATLPGRSWRDNPLFPQIRPLYQDDMRSLLLFQTLKRLNVAVGHVQRTASGFLPFNRLPAKRTGSLPTSPARESAGETGRPHERSSGSPAPRQARKSGTHTEGVRIVARRDDRPPLGASRGANPPANIFFQSSAVQGTVGLEEKTGKRRI